MEHQRLAGDAGGQRQSSKQLLARFEDDLHSVQTPLSACCEITLAAPCHTWFDKSRTYLALGRAILCLQLLMEAIPAASTLLMISIIMTSILIPAERSQATRDGRHISKTEVKHCLPQKGVHRESVPHILVQVTDSWLPRSRNTAEGSASFQAASTASSSTPQAPRSTKSPLKTNSCSADGQPAASILGASKPEGYIQQLSGKAQMQLPAKQ